MLVYKAQASLSKSPGPPPVQHCGGGACNCWWSAGSRSGGARICWWPAGSRSGGASSCWWSACSRRWPLEPSRGFLLGEHEHATRDHLLQYHCWRGKSDDKKASQRRDRMQNENRKTARREAMLRRTFKERDSLKQQLRDSEEWNLRRGTGRVRRARQQCHLCRRHRLQ